MTLSGGAGDDTLTVEMNAATIDNPNTTIEADGGATLDGGAGTDTLRGGAGRDATTPGIRLPTQSLGRPRGGACR